MFHVCSSCSDVYIYIYICIFYIYIYREREREGMCVYIHIHICYNNNSMPQSLCIVCVRQGNPAEAIGGFIYRNTTIIIIWETQVAWTQWQLLWCMHPSSHLACMLGHPNICLPKCEGGGFHDKMQVPNKAWISCLLMKFIMWTTSGFVFPTINALGILIALRPTYIHQEIRHFVTKKSATQILEKSPS